MTYDYNSYKKPLSKSQKVKRDKELEVQRLLKEKHEREEAERIRKEKETKEEKLRQISEAKKKLEDEIKKEQERERQIQERITFIKTNYTLDKLKVKIDELNDVLKTFKPDYKKLVIEQHYQKQYDELFEIYNIISSDDETEVKALLDGLKA